MQCTPNITDARKRTKREVKKKEWTINQCCGMDTSRKSHAHNADRFVICHCYCWALGCRYARLLFSVFSLLYAQYLCSDIHVSWVIWLVTACFLLFWFSLLTHAWIRRFDNAFSYSESYASLNWQMTALNEHKIYILTVKFKHKIE